MKKQFLPLLMGAMLFAALSGMPLYAQNAVVNPLFQTADMQYWTGTDPSYGVLFVPPSLGLDQYAMRKMPGTPDNNGSVTQQVHLIGGFTYQFSADVVAKYCSS